MNKLSNVKRLTSTPLITKRFRFSNYVFCFQLKKFKKKDIFLVRARPNTSDRRDPLVSEKRKPNL